VLPGQDSVACCLCATPSGAGLGQVGDGCWSFPLSCQCCALGSANSRLTAMLAVRGFPSSRATRRTILEFVCRRQRGAFNVSGQSCRERFACYAPQIRPPWLWHAMLGHAGAVVAGTLNQRRIHSLPRASILNFSFDVGAETDGRHPSRATAKAANEPPCRMIYSLKTLSASHSKRFSTAALTHEEASKLNLNSSVFLCSSVAFLRCSRCLLAARFRRPWP
jgi:hypothetical protein